MNIDHPTVKLKGIFRDVMRDASGRVVRDSGICHNAIVDDCRRLLSGFMRGTPTGTIGIQGLQVGGGDPAWDGLPAPPPATAGQTALVDPAPFTLPLVDLQLDYLTGGVVSATPTNTLRIIASFAPGVPAWPDASHSTATLREFGLVAELDGAPVLIDYVTHPAIAKDPVSTLDRTIWLVF